MSSPSDEIFEFVAASEHAYWCKYYKALFVRSGVVDCEIHGFISLRKCVKCKGWKEVKKERA